MKKLNMSMIADTCEKVVDLSYGTALTAGGISKISGTFGNTKVQGAANKVAAAGIIGSLVGAVGMIAGCLLED